MTQAAEAEVKRLREAIVAHRATKLGVTRLGETRLDAFVDGIVHLDAADLDLWDALYYEDGDTMRDDAWGEVNRHGGDR